MKHHKLGQRRIVTDATKPLGQRQNPVKCPYCGGFSDNGRKLIHHIETTHQQTLNDDNK